MASSTMEKPPLSTSHHLQKDEQDFINLRDWGLKNNKIISRENTKSRRFLASNIRCLTEETRSFRSNNATISSTASSPGYILRDEIDPSSYSFTTALRALQVKSGYNWEYLSSPDGFALNSKWNEAERYICNPLSGEVPIECLSAKTLSGRCINKIPITTTLRSRITVSGPLVYSTSPHHVHSKPTLTQQEDAIVKSPIKEEKGGVMKNFMSTRDVGTQSTPPYVSSSSPSPTSTPSIKERSLKRCEMQGDDESPKSGSKSKILEKEEVEGEEKREKEEVTNKEEVKNKDKQMWKCFKLFGTRRRRRCYCCCLLPWRSSLWMRKKGQRGKHTSQVNFESNILE